MLGHGWSLLLVDSPPSYHRTGAGIATRFSSIPKVAWDVPSHLPGSTANWVAIPLGSRHTLGMQRDVALEARIERVVPAGTEPLLGLCAHRAPPEMSMYLSVLLAAEEEPLARGLESEVSAATARSPRVRLAATSRVLPRQLGTLGQGESAPDGKRIS